MRYECVTVAGLLLAGLSVGAVVRPAQAEVPVAPAERGGKTARARASADERYCDELIRLLKRTRSSDAFIVTLSQLQKAGADPRRVVPVAIRRAERLGIFGRNLFKTDASGGKSLYEASMPAGVVMDLLDEMSKGSPARDIDPPGGDPQEMR